MARQRTYCGLVLIAGAILLGGCATTGNSGQSAQQRIQNAINATCQVVPTVATITNIIATFSSPVAALAAINDIAAGVCAALATPKMQLTRKAGVTKYRAAAPTYRGVKIKLR